MKLAPVSLSLVTKGNYLFVFGIDAEYWREIAVRFDVRKNKWLDLKIPPCNTSQGRRATLLEENIYLLGGVHVTKETSIGMNATNTIDVNNISADAFKYSLVTNSWSKLQNLPRRLASHAAASHGNYVFCVGGFAMEINSLTATDKLFAYDVVARIWLSKASMNSRRAGLSLEVVGTKLVACGGKSSPSVEIYDIANDQWTVMQNAILQHFHCPSMALNDKVYVIGGSVRGKDGTSSATNYVSCVDVSNGKIRRVSSIQFRAVGHACALLIVPNAT